MTTHCGLALALACLFFIGCDTRAATDPEIARLSQCVVKNVEQPREWQKVKSPRGELTLALPQKFVATTEPQGIHGGQGWRDRDRRLGMSYGYWSMSSFPPDVARCRLSVRGRDVVVFDYGRKTGTSVVAWFVGSGAGEQPPYDVVFEFSSSRASDQEVFETILQTVRY